MIHCVRKKIVSLIRVTKTTHREECKVLTFTQCFLCVLEPETTLTLTLALALTIDLTDDHPRDIIQMQMEQHI